MRTTIDLDDDILKVAKHLAQERTQSLGRVLSDLARQGLQPGPRPRVRGGVIPVLARKPGARAVTMQEIKNLEESEA